jgi:hypothetical protein
MGVTYLLIIPKINKSWISDCVPVNFCCVPVEFFCVPVDC